MSCELKKQAKRKVEGGGGLCQKTGDFTRSVLQRAISEGFRMHLEKKKGTPP